MDADPFELLGAERRFDLDLGVLEKQHREMSRVLHPDRAGAPSARREALERAASVNEAWRTLRDPIKRAEALFRLEGIAIDEANQPKADAAFLMNILEQREALAEARASKDIDKVEALASVMRKKQKHAEAALTEGFRTAPDKSALVPLLGELRYYKRFLDEVAAFEEEMST